MSATWKEAFKQTDLNSPSQKYHKSVCASKFEGQQLSLNYHLQARNQVTGGSSGKGWRCVKNEGRSCARASCFRPWTYVCVSPYRLCLFGNGGYLLAFCPQLISLLVHHLLELQHHLPLLPLGAVCTHRQGTFFYPEFRVRITSWWHHSAMQ